MQHCWTCKFCPESPEQHEVLRSVPNLFHVEQLGSNETSNCLISEWFCKSKPSQINPWSPKGIQDGPQRVPRGSLGKPRGAPRDPRVASWSPQGCPREPQGSCKATQGIPEARPRAENPIQNVLKIDFEADVGSEPHSKPIVDRFFMEIATKFDLQIDGELRRKVSSKLPSTNQAMLRKSWFYLGKTTHFVMPTKKQTRQRNARNRPNHH